MIEQNIGARGMVAAAAARAVLVSAVASGQGKTSVTAALARKLTRQGSRVRVFKCGPDFLDPMLLQRACATPVRNLDLWMVGPERCRRLLAEAAMQADAILIEGVMGLYDGTPSSADLARAFGVPVLAVIDASAMAQSAGALALGLRDYGPVALAGVIANRLAGARHGQMVAEALRDIPLLGSLPFQSCPLPERHLGLVPPDQVDAIDALLDTLAGQLVFDQQAWNAIGALSVDAAPAATMAPMTVPLAGKTIAVARDAAFAFLYPDNLDCLRQLGAALIFFSPLADQAIPAQADALYLPGGYPELHGETLSTACCWRRSVRDFHAAGKPMLAECGGMMALADSICASDGKLSEMAGILPGAVRMQERLAALGPQSLAGRHGELRGHAFHYSRLETILSPVAHAKKHLAGVDGEAVYRVGSLTASYFHAYFPSCPQAVADIFLGRSLS